MSVANPLKTIPCSSTVMRVGDSFLRKLFEVKWSAFWFCSNNTMKANHFQYVRTQQKILSRFCCRSDYSEHILYMITIGGHICWTVPQGILVSPGPLSKVPLPPLQVKLWTTTGNSVEIARLADLCSCTYFKILRICDFLHWAWMR